MIPEGEAFPNMESKNYNPETGVITYKATSDVALTTDRTKNTPLDAFGFILKVKETNTTEKGSIVLQGAEDGKVATFKVGGEKDAGKNLFIGNLTLIIDSLPVVKKEEVKVEEKEPIPTKVEVKEAPVKKEVKKEVVKKIETGKEEILLTLFILLIA